VGSAYWALVVGSVGSLRAISATINSATPLILCGVSVAVAFKAGLFNIGATGQMLAGGMAALWVGFAMDGPGYVQVPLAVLAGALGGAAYGAIPGILKARTGAHEVITTIMLNNMAGFLVLWLLKTNLYQREDRTDPISKLVSAPGHLPRLFGFMDDRPDLIAHAGFVVAILAVIVYSWFLNRSTTGFEFRAFGMNADAAQYAGMHTKRLTVMAMMFAGAFAGLAGSAEVLGTYRTMFSSALTHPKLCLEFFEKGPLEVHQQVAKYLQQCSKEGSLKITNIDISTSQFLSLFLGLDHIRCMLGLKKPTKKDDEQLVLKNVDFFIQASRN
jgi:simple sugar transport system permease protein